MSTYIFGYGSLINLDSISRTLKRSISIEEVIPDVTLKGFTRNWTMMQTIFSKKLDQEINGVFLNVEPSHYNVCCNGIAFKVTEVELNYLLMREKNYDVVDVSKNITTFVDVNAKILLFSGQSDFLIKNIQKDCYVMQRYIDMIRDGCMYWGNEFMECFNETTENIFLPILDENYVFLDTNQKENL